MQQLLLSVGLKLATEQIVCAQYDSGQYHSQTFFLIILLYTHTHTQMAHTHTHSVYTHSELTVATNSIDYVVFVSRAHVAIAITSTCIYIYIYIYVVCTYVRMYNVWSHDLRSLDICKAVVSFLDPTPLQGRRVW